MPFRIQGLGFGVCELRVHGVGEVVPFLEFRVQSAGFRAYFGSALFGRFKLLLNSLRGYSML